MGKRITSIDVAKLAGVSQSTVSRVFSKGDKVDVIKRKQVLEATEKLGYQPNALARGLITNKTKMVGIVMRDIQNPFYPEVLEAFYKVLSKKGYHIIFINSEKALMNEKEVNRLIEYHVEGVIITDSLLTSSAFHNLTKNSISVILFNRYIEGNQCSAVYCDNYLGGDKIANYLIETGHIHFGAVYGPLDTSTGLDRKKGFEEVLNKHGMDLQVENANYSYESGYEATIRLLETDNKIDSLFCGNDIIALGAIDAAKSLGYELPNDLSIIGFDDIHMAKWPSYSLTTWKQPIEKMVNSCVEILIKEIYSEQSSPLALAFPGEIIERHSTINRLETTK